jgi:hypothetical protein
MATDDMTCIPCGLIKHTRNHYFNGKLLVERDFVDEQIYYIAKRRMLNKVLHGNGTVCGLKLRQHPAPDCQTQYIYAESGVALDCCGREIVLTKNEPINIPLLIEEAGLILDEPVDLFVAIQYHDVESEQVPVILPDCDCADANQAANRIDECFTFKVFAREPGTTELVRPPIEAKLDWLHTIPLSEQTPLAIAVDNHLQQIYVAALSTNEGEDEAVTGRIYAYRADNHDLITALNAGTAPQDLLVSALGAHIFLCDENLAADTPLGALSGIAIYAENNIQANPDPIAYIDLGEPARIAISPTTGALFALGLNTGVLTAWSEAEFLDWLATDAGNGFPDPAGPASPHGVTLNGFSAPAGADIGGASIIKIGANGLFVFVVNPSANGDNSVLVVNISRLFANEAGALIETALPDVETDERGIAIQTSIADAGFIFVLTQTSDGEESRLRRFEWQRESQTFVASGRGGFWAGAARDLAISATEKWAYVPQRLTQAGESISQVAVISIDQVISVENPELINALSKHVRINGDALFSRLNLVGRRLYVASSDEDTATNPDRGLVAVLDIEEADCGELFFRSIDGCPACDDDEDACVVLGHLGEYEVGQRMLEADSIRDQAAEAEIDNLTYRKVVASNQRLMEVVLCMLEEGFATGAPGPRGRPGPDGTQGNDGTNGTNGTDGVNGTDGTDGGIGIQGERGLQGIQGPLGEGTQEPEVIRIQAISWVHDLHESEYGGVGAIALAFDKQVLQGSVISRHEFTDVNPRSCVFEAYVELVNQADDGTTVWGRVPMRCFPLSNISTDSFSYNDAGETVNVERIVDFSQEVPKRDAVTSGFILIPTDDFKMPFDVKIKVTFKGDFATDEGRKIFVDGNHMGGRLPAGNNIPGSTFESWFWTRRG